jgi:hypothetical protein
MIRGGLVGLDVQQFLIGRQRQEVPDLAAALDVCLPCGALGSEGLAVPVLRARRAFQGHAYAR